MDILTLGNEVLRQKAEPVTDIDDTIRSFVKELFETLKVGKGVGLAAPQVGSSLRVFVTDFEEDQPRVFINPSLLSTSEDLSNYEEGCLSVPGVWADVQRPAKVTIQAWNERGRPFTLEAEGFLARVIQHEYDHLNGTLFIDRLSELKRDRLVAQYEKKKRV